MNKVAESPSFMNQLNNMNVLIGTVPNGLLVVNNQGTIVLCNSEVERMFGYEQGELLEKSVDILVPQNFCNGHDHHRNSFFKNPSKRKMGEGRSLTGVCKGGQEIPVEIGLNHMKLSGNIFVVASVVDITQRKKIEDDLQKAYHSLQLKNEEMEQFVYSVSHDLKSPLVTISSFIGFLREDLEKNKIEDVKDSIDHIERAQLRMKELIEELLDLSRLGRLDLNLEKVDLNDIIKESLSFCNEKADEIGVNIHVSNDFPSLIADSKRIRQLCDNLVCNAFHYGMSKEHPSLDIFWKDQGDRVILCFKDNGKGISPKYHKKVFELFKRLDSHSSL